MRNQQSARPEAPPGILDRALFGGRFSGLKRYLRWFNLTVLQQALWPLLIAVFSAPQVDLEDTPSGWYVGRIAGPVIAFALAWIYYQSYHRSDWRSSLRTLLQPRSPARFAELARQLRYALLGIPVAVGMARLAAGPADEVAKITLFGLANVAAYHLIHFGVVPQLFTDRRQGLQASILLFGLSWGLHDALMVGLTEDGSWALAFAVGLFLGWIVAAVSLAIRRWPGGAPTAAAAHFLLVYLIFGFV